ncbi:MAG TPA: hypothetical protein VI776_16530 [Anaerolineales bacterium]|nr:hypothetical protein [Anaerolineales bacterium]
MSRVIHIESVGKDRKKISQAIVLAIRELVSQAEPNDMSRDLAAFISLSLEAIYQTIDMSVAAWEKRGYWLKADRFRLDWAWTGALAKEMRAAVLSEDWPQVAAAAVQVAQKLNTVKVSPNNRLGTPWVGAHQKLSHSNRHA